MIHRLSLEIADYLFYRKIITIDKYDVYRYGLEMIISTVLGVILVLLCGILTDSFIHAILFYGLFVILRMYTGGYHADSHIACKMTLCGSFLITYFTLKMLLVKFNIKILLIFVLFNLASAVSIAPVECVKKPISKHIKCKNKFVSIILYFVLAILSICLYIMSYHEWSLFLILVISDVTLLMYIGNIKERRRGYEIR